MIAKAISRSISCALVPGIALLTVAADCVPVMMGDSDAGVVAVVHAGWPWWAAAGRCCSTPSPWSIPG